MSGCSISAREPIVTGDRGPAGTGVLMVADDRRPISPAGRNDHRQTRRSPITIGADVFIGTRAVILKRVDMGEGAVVGAASVATRSVPPFAIVAGNPARLIENSRQA